MKPESQTETCTEMTNNGLGITSIAKHCWACNLPIKEAVKHCIDTGFYRDHITRFIETIYEQQSVDFGLWCDGFKDVR